MQALQIVALILVNIALLVHLGEKANVIGEIVAESSVW